MGGGRLRESNHMGKREEVPTHVRFVFRLLSVV